VLFDASRIPPDKILFEPSESGFHLRCPALECCFPKTRDSRIGVYFKKDQISPPHSHFVNCESGDFQSA
jgi:hypothetical protein